MLASDLSAYPGTITIKEGNYFIAVREDEDGNEYYDTNTMASSMEEFRRFERSIRTDIGDEWLEGNPTVRVDEISVSRVKSHSP
jgi:uncharacterized protein (DUF2141 family)